MSTPTVFNAPGVGQIVHLANYLIRNRVMVEKTMPDTPDVYSSELEIMGDQGDMNLDPLRGTDGRNGQVTFAFRRQDEPVYTDPSQLRPLKNAPSDIGKYWLFDEVDSQGTVIAQYMYAWYGTAYRKMMMGSFGYPGAVPDIQPHVQVIDPHETSFIKTGGPTYRPSWEFNLALPAGIPGDPGPVDGMPDVDLVTTPPVPKDLLVATDVLSPEGYTVFRPYRPRGLSPQTFYVPEGVFVAYTGVSQQAPIGSFELPAQPFRWTPVVWGHIKVQGITVGISLPIVGFSHATSPLMVGCQVLLGDAVNGTQIARGLGNTIGEVNVMPHYSTSNDLNKVLSPTNDYAVIEADEADPTLRTIHVNLWNDGQLGAYDFKPPNAQLFIMIVPIERYVPPTRRKKRR